MDLAQQHCVPCEGGTPPLSREEMAEGPSFLSSWERNEDATALEKTYTFTSCKEALHHLNTKGTLAEEAGHHPDLNYTYLTVNLSTHAIGGLSQNDLVLAER